MDLRRSIATVIAAVAAVSAVAAAPPASADVPPDTARVARHVIALSTEAKRRAAAAGAAAGRLAAAAAAQADAEDAAEAAEAALAGSRAGAANRARALYVAGVDLSAGLTLLAAEDPDDALWQLQVGNRAVRTVLADAAGTVRADTAADREATQARRRADDAAAVLARALGQVRAEADAAQQALDEARAELARLSDRDRRAAAARAAQAALDAAAAAAAAADVSSLPPTRALSIPPDYLAAYQAAARTCPGVSWTLLAGIGQVESGHGRNQGPSSAGAIGPMQFMPATFAAYAVDGDGDGATSAWDPQDAIFTAARYLCANGAGTGPDGVHRAVFAYNHAEWYVQLVLAAQQAVASRYEG